MSAVSDEQMDQWELAEEIVKRSVRRGSRYMERRWPGWFTEHFDLKRFDIASGCDCVLGQWFNHVHDKNEQPDFLDYVHALDDLHISPDYAALLGFDLPNQELLERLGLEDLYNDRQWYRILQSEWVAERRFRQAQQEAEQ